MSVAIKCPVCDTVVDELTVDERDNPACYDCSRNTCYCHDCDEACDRDSVTSINGGNVCESCIQDNYFTCGWCSDTISDNDRYETDSHGGVCEFCRDSEFYRCYSCAHIVSSVTEISGEEYCSSCVDDMTVCSVCREYTDSPIDTDDGYLCPSCSRVEARPNLPKMCDGGYLGTRCFGIELEFDEIYENNSSWNDVYDGSLSGDGREFLSGPLRGEDGIKNVISNVKKIRGRVNRKCGFHLHIDMTNESMESAKNVVMTAIGMEDYIFALVSPSRRSNNYCMKIKSRLPELLNQPLDDWTYDSGYDERVTTDKYHGKRYEWINSHSYFYRGTLEIRLHQGTGNPDKVLRWAELWLKIADWAVEQSPNFIRMKCNTPEFTSLVLSAIGLRQSTIEYLNDRQQRLSSSEDEERED